MRGHVRISLLASMALAALLHAAVAAGPAAADDTPSASPAPTRTGGAPGDPATGGTPPGDPGQTGTPVPATSPSPAPSPTGPVVTVPTAPAAPVPSGCTDPLVAVLAGAGFTGTDLREAWAIAMRESGGIATIGPGDPRFNGRDFGLFQLNQPTWGTQLWWDPVLLVTAEYNAAVAYMLSEGGRTWVPWGLDGEGRPRPWLYRDFGWTRQQIRDWVIRPYRLHYRAYPC